MKKSTTKMSLVASIAALVLCCAMLIGTTFAWFTDSASTAVNKIQAGTLDVQLLDESGNSLEGQTLAWQKAAGHESEEVLWEPGCTYKLQPIVIKNNGNLALKYKIVITGIQGDAELNEAIEWTITNTSATTALDADHPLAAGASDTLTISGHMKESAGNEYQGLSIEGIAITVVATQDTVEHDSYDNQYDAGAEYPVLSDTEFAEAIANATAGDTITLSSGTFILPATAIPAGVTVSGNGAGNTVIAVDASGYTIENDDVTLKDLKIDGSATSSVEHGKAIYLKGNNARIENCVISGGGTTTWGASVCVILQEGETAYITNTVISGGFRGVLLNLQNGSAVIDSCEIDAVYPINVNGGGDFSLTVINSKLHGWTSYAQITSATFIDTEFSMGASGYDVVAAYTDTTFKNCTFDSAFKIYAQIPGFGFVFENCMKDGVAVTAENFKTLFPEDPDVWTRCTCTVNGVTVTP